MRGSPTLRGTGVSLRVLGEEHRQRVPDRLGARRRHSLARNPLIERRKLIRLEPDIDAFASASGRTASTFYGTRN
jgi:hypothetical protein